MKKNKGFTLIELLAIIVILAIIAVITVPIILNIIENSKKGAATDSAYGYKDAVNKWYIEKLSLDHNFNLSSSYTVTNGNLGNEQIPFSGDKPTSGYLNYTNNVLTTGCLVFGDYAVTFTNGEVSSTVKGECTVEPQETVLYYTYDASATAVAGYKNSEKEEQPDSSWVYYIEETTQPGVTSYGVELTIGGDTITGAGYDSLAECESILTTYASQLSSVGTNPQCVELDDKITYAIYGVEGGNSFMLSANDYANSISILDGIYGEEGCYPAGSSATTCSGSDTGVYVTQTGDVTVGAQGSCFVGTFGFAGCKQQ